MRLCSPPVCPFRRGVRGPKKVPNHLGKPNTTAVPPVWITPYVCGAPFFISCCVFFQGMRQRGTQPDVFSFNGVMQANVAGGNWAAALEVCIYGCLPSVSFPQTGHGTILKQMMICVDRKWEPSFSCGSAASRSFLCRGGIAALAFFCGVPAAVRLVAMSLAFVVEAILRLGNGETTVSSDRLPILLYMCTICIFLNVHLCHVCVLCHAWKVLEEIRSKGLEPDVTSFNIAVHACAVGCQWQVRAGLVLC